MDINCKWSAIQGKAKKIVNCGGELVIRDITFYGGGNVLSCICYEDSKNLYSFFIDSKHAKSFINNENDLGLNDIIIYIHEDKKLNKDCKILAKLLIELKIPFTYKIYDLPY